MIGTYKICLCCDESFMDMTTNRNQKYCSKKCRDSTYYHNNKDKVRAISRACKYKATFGITQEDYDNFVEAQGNKCAICAKEETTLANNGKIKRLSVDHCHITGEVRGLLCYHCNLVLGHARDNPEILESCIKYLQKPSNL